MWVRKFDGGATAQFATVTVEAVRVDGEPGAVMIPVEAEGFAVILSAAEVRAVHTAAELGPARKQVRGSLCYAAFIALCLGGVLTSWANGSNGFTSLYTAGAVAVTLASWLAFGLPDVRKILRACAH